MAFAHIDLPLRSLTVTDAHARSTCPPCALLTQRAPNTHTTNTRTHTGLDWTDRSRYCQNIANPDDQPPYNPRQEYRSYECVMSLNTIYGIFIALWLGYFVLAVYFDNIVPNEFGVSK